MKLTRAISQFVAILLFAILSSCVPKEEIVFKGVKNIAVDINGGQPVMKADADFFNPNKTGMKLKEVDIEVFVDGKKSAEVKQHLNILIPPHADFSIPIEAKLALKETNFLDTMVGLLGGRKYEVYFKGMIKVHVHGFPIKVPVSQKQELKLNM
jgi:hypothetical protein